MHRKPQGLGQGDISIFWRVCLVNAAVFAAATAVLAATPATVSYPIAASELAVLLVGLAAIVVGNAALMKTVLAPLDSLRHLMAKVDLLRPGQRLPESGHGPIREVISAFNAMVDRLEAERATSNHRALVAQEEERRRVAQELHDEVGQSLTAVLLGLRQVADRVPADLAPEVGLAQEAARSSIEEVGRVVRRLRPGVLDDLGLCSALASLGTEHARLTGSRVQRRLDSSLPRLDPAVELAVYRVAQEALTNVARHAGADEVVVELAATEEGRVLLRITDDGRGMDGSDEGAGIRGMRERALLLGARLDVGSRRSGGTEVCLLAPARTPVGRS